MSAPQGLEKGDKLLWKYEETRYFVSFLWSESKIEKDYQIRQQCFKALPAGQRELDIGVVHLLDQWSPTLAGINSLNPEHYLS